MYYLIEISISIVIRTNKVYGKTYLKAFIKIVSCFPTYAYLVALPKKTKLTIPKLERDLIRSVLKHDGPRPGSPADAWDRRRDCVCTGYKHMARDKIRSFTPVHIYVHIKPPLLRVLVLLQIRRKKLQ